MSCSLICGLDVLFNGVRLWLVMLCFCLVYGVYVCLVFCGLGLVVWLLWCLVACFNWLV